MKKFNIHSKLINISELARRLNTQPPVLHNRIKGIGAHKPLSIAEIAQIKKIIEADLNL